MLHILDVLHCTRSWVVIYIIFGLSPQNSNWI